jgi:hypothetical protein
MRSSYRYANYYVRTAPPQRQILVASKRAKQQETPAHPRRCGARCFGQVSSGFRPRDGCAIYTDKRSSVAEQISGVGTIRAEY